MPVTLEVYLTHTTEPANLPEISGLVMSLLEKAGFSDGEFILNVDRPRIQDHAADQVTLSGLTGKRAIGLAVVRNEILYQCALIVPVIPGTKEFEPREVLNRLLGEKKQEQAASLEVESNEPGTDDEDEVPESPRPEPAGKLVGVGELESFKSGPPKPTAPKPRKAKLAPGETFLDRASQVLHVINSRSSDGFLGHRDCVEVIKTLLGLETESANQLIAKLRDGGFLTRLVRTGDPGNLITLNGQQLLRSRRGTDIIVPPPPKPKEEDDEMALGDFSGICKDQDKIRRALQAINKASGNGRISRDQCRESVVSGCGLKDVRTNVLGIFVTSLKRQGYLIQVKVGDEVMFEVTPLGRQLIGATDGNNGGQANPAKPTASPPPVKAAATPVAPAPAPAAKPAANAPTTPATAPAPPKPKPAPKQPTAAPKSPASLPDQIRELEEAALSYAQAREKIVQARVAEKEARQERERLEAILADTEAARAHKKLVKIRRLLGQ